MLFNFVCTEQYIINRRNKIISVLIYDFLFFDHLHSLYLCQFIVYLIFPFWKFYWYRLCNFMLSSFISYSFCFMYLTPVLFSHEEICIHNSLCITSFFVLYDAFGFVFSSVLGHSSYFHCIMFDFSLLDYFSKIFLW